MTRRELLGAGIAAPAVMAQQPPASSDRRTKTAAIVTAYRYYSHADVLVGRLLTGYSPNAIWEPSNTRIVSIYTDQMPVNTDMTKDQAARSGFKVHPTIREALTLGGVALAVDGVVFIGEHGDYPLNDLGQQLYPRFELFSQILDVYEQTGRSVPTFFDKHFSYSWEKAETMYRRAKKLGFPFMAGSSIPLTIRRPAFDPPLETPITDAVALGYGDPDAYGFHTLEALQCIVERRKGGETGIASVQWIEGGEAIQAWRDGPGAWSTPLFKPLLEDAKRLAGLPESWLSEEHSNKPVLFVLRYRDGLRAAAMVLTQNVGWSTAIKVKGEDRPQTVAYSFPVERPLPNWDGMARSVDRFLATGQAPNPVERTLLVTGALAFCFASKKAGKPVDTPQLEISYRGPVHGWFQTA